MARIRTIKPEFFTSEDIVELDPLGRLLYIALWCEADKEGRLSWKPKTFKMRYLPADQCDIDALCDALVTRGLVVLYGDGLAFIPAFKDHQHINPREKESTYPEPTDELINDACATRAPRVSDETVTVKARAGRKEGKEGKDKHASKFDATEFLKSRGVEDRVITGWLAVRKLKDAANTEVAFEAVVVQAEKAGLSVNDAIKRSVENSWAGFKANWLKDDPNDPPEGWVPPRAGDTRVRNGITEVYRDGAGWAL